ncbi:unnamed protein product [Moneuplotes crassus]|uniref:Uncharacterized protein n=1 Tax=Euplotes crassus TaxID=5936 RepID=A0AAD1UBD1_EUPCR|nr:unnamed protein product [Moneuplotes crassus]
METHKSFKIEKRVNLCSEFTFRKTEIRGDKMPLMKISAYLHSLPLITSKLLPDRNHTVMKVCSCYWGFINICNHLAFQAITIQYPYRRKVGFNQCFSLRSQRCHFCHKEGNLNLKILRRYIN